MVIVLGGWSWYDATNAVSLCNVGENRWQTGPPLQKKEEILRPWYAMALFTSLVDTTATLLWILLNVSMSAIYFIHHRLPLLAVTAPMDGRC